jgi:signal transduction histidine kinase
MAAVESLTKLSPVPVVDLDDIQAPRDGLLIPTSPYCRSHFGQGTGCSDHYKRLATDGALTGQPVQCPFGLCSYVVRTQRSKLALTGIVPYPRLGGIRERQVAKKNSLLRYPIASLEKTSLALREAESAAISLEQEFIEKHSLALHEIRKLNRTVKQTAERMCLQQRPHDPDAADASLVQIWKSAELMSVQFDIIELLANQTLTDLPLNTPVEVYRIFDKCVRIYRAANESRRISLKAAPGYSPRIQACDKTFPMIPTVLIENAIRYSLPASDITIDIERAKGHCVICVNNLTAMNNRLNDTIFQRGVRASTDGEGSGHGLFLAKLVTEQHLGTIRLALSEKAGNQIRVTFVVSLPEIQAKKT